MSHLRIVLVFGLLFCQMKLYGQEEKSLTELGDEAFLREEYAVAARLYTRVAEKRGERASLKLMEKIARSYREMTRFNMAGYWYKQMLLRPDCPASVNMVYGELMKNIETYDSAKIYLQRFTSSNADSMKLKNMLIAGCDSALLWKTGLLTLAVENMKELSSDGDDWISGVRKDGLLLVSNGYRKMSLTSGAERNPAIDPRVNMPYSKAYLFKQYEKGSRANTYMEEIVPDILGKLPYHVGPVCFNSREDTMYITLNVPNKNLTDRKKRGPVNGRRLISLSRSVKKEDKWSVPEPVTELNAPGSYTGNAVLNETGSIMYFVSDRPGGLGGKDIWYSERQRGGHWSTPVNCGPVINTPYEESFPTVNEANTLYFSSKGHAGMGGFDIFRAEGKGNNWTDIRNMRSPFNSGGDDLGFIMKSNMYEGYFSSNRPASSEGDDIYHFLDNHFTEKLKDPDAGKPPVVIEEVPKVLPPAPVHKENIDSMVIDKLERMSFYYDYNSTILLTESRELLDRLAVVLSQYPGWKLMIRSYTDSRGSDNYNMNLSAMRCFAVIEYLIKKGVAPGRLYYENLGEKDLITPCGNGVPCDDTDHRKNRRTMLRVIK
ncbi:OmpA family protein [Chitinophaga sp. ysch24]|uniref:OmpA family protein n=2 Tax=Chitinophaga tropicalis TaxID=2683588 RepID=A0A7K1U1M3_9BACT|nr:OmpA family protein [Chitinophaga tropicalis]